MPEIDGLPRAWRTSVRDEGLEGEDGAPQAAAASAGSGGRRTTEPRKADAKRAAASPKHTTALAWQRAACTSGARSVPLSRPPRSTTGRTSSKAARALSVASTLVAFESFTHRTPATYPQGSRRCSSGAKPTSAWETVRASTPRARAALAAQSAFATLCSPLICRSQARTRSCSRPPQATRSVPSSPRNAALSLPQAVRMSPASPAAVPTGTYEKPRSAGVCARRARTVRRTTSSVASRTATEPGTAGRFADTRSLAAA